MIKEDINKVLLLFNASNVDHSLSATGDGIHVTISYGKNGLTGRKEFKC